MSIAVEMNYEFDRPALETGRKEKTNMKRWIKVGVFVVLGMWTATVVGAAEVATKDECVSKVKAVAAMVKEQGPEAAIAKVNDPKSEFTWKDSYVFLLDAETGVTLAHPANPKLVGKMMTGLKDSNGKMFFVEFLNVANGKGEGWVDYSWPKPGETTPSPKSTYVLKIPGTNLIAAAGIYP
ncbi:Cache, type 2 domain protein [Syntrophobacter sp. SbD1]|nr:Cache, type 2 domain protein [Syntrophobacter sp. SbD1]